MKQVRVLVVDDERNYLKVMQGELEARGFNVLTSGSSAEALDLARRHPVDILIADLNMPGMDGIELLRIVRTEDLQAEVIVVTGGGDIPTAVEAMKSGAYDYVQKPLDLEKLSALIEKAAEKKGLDRENRRLRSALERADRTSPILGGSEGIRHALEIARRAAGAPSPVLVQGETGTGKELFARFIHQESPRAGEPLVIVNCATLPDNLIESELFGHRKGAFTGADAAREGLFEMADGGTIFLDEIAEIPMALQAKLLRAIQFGEIKRVGDSTSRTIDARIIAATGRNLPEEVRQGRFREDLYFRLNVLEVRLPPLRERVEDIPLIVEGILRRWAGAGSRRRFSSRSMDLLNAYAWPGNVRQLENLVERSLILSDQEEMDLDASPFRSELRGMLAGPIPPSEYAYGLTLRDAEREHIRRTLDRVGGNRDKAAQELGISRRSLYYKLKELGLKD